MAIKVIVINWHGKSHFDGISCHLTGQLNFRFEDRLLEFFPNAEFQQPFFLRSSDGQYPLPAGRQSPISNVRQSNSRWLHATSFFIQKSRSQVRRRFHYATFPSLSADDHEATRCLSKAAFALRFCMGKALKDGCAWVHQRPLRTCPT
jgi:hypothetical protein